MFPPRGPLTRLRDSDDVRAERWLGTPTLGRNGVTLRPLVASDAEALAAVPGGEAELYQFTGPVPTDVDAALAGIRAAGDDPKRLAFAVIDDETGRLVGTTSYYDVDEANLALAIGYTYYAPDVVGTHVNPTAKLLLLDYAFTELGAVRVVWHTKAENARSRAAIAKLGASFEGELAKHRRFGTGWRTTAQFAMTDDEWATHRERLVERVEAAPALVY
ncbi:MAG: GNAT family protein [Gordonia sp. (in: high G+C Gram-positive bacteria)]